MFVFYRPSDERMREVHAVVLPVASYWGSLVRFKHKRVCRSFCFFFKVLGLWIALAQLFPCWLQCSGHIVPMSTYCHVHTSPCTHTPTRSLVLMSLSWCNSMFLEVPMSSCPQLLRNGLVLQRLGTLHRNKRMCLQITRALNCTCIAFSMLAIILWACGGMILKSHAFNVAWLCWYH